MISFKTRYLFFSIAIAGVLFAGTFSAGAQDKARPKAQAVRARAVQAIQMLRPAVPLQPGQPGNPIEQQKTKYAEEMAVHIDELDRVCSLSASQRKKLALAAKGAVAATMEEWKVCARQVQDRLGGRLLAAPVARPVPARGADDVEDEGPEKKDEEEPELRIDARLLSILNASGYLPEPHRQARWVRALGKVLSDEQHAKVDAAESARRKHRRTFGVATHVDQLDYLLRFSPEQRQRVTEIVDSIMGPFLEGEIAPGRNVYVYGDVPRIEKRDLQPVLSETQSRAWTRHMDARLNANGRFIGPGFRRAMPMAAGPAQPSVTLGMAYIAGPLSAGVRIDYLAPDGPAAKAGMMLRDQLKSIDGSPIQSWVVVNSRLNGKRPGDTVKLVVIRGGEERSFDVVVQERESKKFKAARAVTGGQ